jgi:superfamily I DNA/RNA helicase
LETCRHPPSAHGHPQRQAGLRSPETRSGKRAYDPRKPQVNILSVQSSKGLEFRSVIFIGLGQIETSETQAAQNMKLLYVGHDPGEGTAADHGFGEE